MIDQAASNLQRLSQLVDGTKQNKPISLNVVTGTDMSYTRPDGVNVISIADLGI